MVEFLCPKGVQILLMKGFQSCLSTMCQEKDVLPYLIESPLDHALLLDEPMKEEHVERVQATHLTREFQDESLMHGALLVPVNESEFAPVLLRWRRDLRGQAVKGPFRHLEGLPEEGPP